MGSPLRTAPNRTKLAKPIVPARRCHGNRHRAESGRSATASASPSPLPFSHPQLGKSAVHWEETTHYTPGFLCVFASLLSLVPDIRFLHTLSQPLLRASRAIEVRAKS